MIVKRQYENLHREICLLYYHAAVIKRMLNQTEKNSTFYDIFVEKLKRRIREQKKTVRDNNKNLSNASYDRQMNIIT